MAQKVEQDPKYRWQDQIYTKRQNSIALMNVKKCSEEQGIEGWVAQRSQKTDYLSQKHYMEYDMMESKQIDEGWLDSQNKWVIDLEMKLKVQMIPLAAKSSR